MAKEESISFKEKKIILEIEKANELERHNHRILELTFKRNSAKIEHEQSLERNRIKTAEIRKSQDRMALLNYDKQFKNS